MIIQKPQNLKQLAEVADALLEPIMQAESSTRQTDKQNTAYALMSGEEFIVNGNTISITVLITCLLEAIIEKNENKDLIIEGIVVYLSKVTDVEKLITFLTKHS